MNNESVNGKSFFKQLEDAFRISPGFRLLIAVLLSVLMTLVVSSFLVSCEKAILPSEDAEDPEEATTTKGRGELYVTCSFSQTQSEISNAKETDGGYVTRAASENVTRATSENVTRATSKPLYECASRVQFIVMNGETIVYNSEQVNGGGSSFGTLSINLEPGTYRLLVFAHNEGTGNPIAVGTDGSIQGYNNRATDSFSYSTEVVITKDKRKSVSCKLTRCVAQVYFNSTDEVPSEVAKFRMTLTGVSSKYDLVNQIGADATTYSTSLVGISRWTSQSGTLANVNSFVFLPAIAAQIDAKFEFFDSNDELVMTRHITGIQMKINAKTTVTGTFFQSDGMDAAVAVDDEWGEGIVVNN